jgi:hypothetical protein
MGEDNFVNHPLTKLSIAQAIIINLDGFSLTRINHNADEDMLMECFLLIMQEGQTR